MLYQQERANKGLLMDVLALRNAARSVRERQLTKTIKPTVGVQQGKVVVNHTSVHWKNYFLLYAPPGVGDAAPPLFASDVRPGGGQVFTLIPPRYWSPPLHRRTAYAGLEEYL